MAKKHKKHKKNKKPLGFTNKLAIILVIMLCAGLAGGFYLANKSINSQYDGALYCYTIVFTPIGTALSIVLSEVIKKNRDENTDENGKGVAYAIAEANNFYQAPQQETIIDDNTSI